LNEALTYIAEHHWADFADVVGLVITVIGFGATLWATLRAKKASEQAKDAVADVQRRLAYFDMMAELASAIAVMDEIKRHQRENRWTMLPDRYSNLKRSLISIKASHPDLSDEESATMQAAIQHFTNIEQQVERVLAKSGKQPDVVRLNRIVSAQIDALTGIIISLRSKVAG
jgi:hypothetical protein